MFYNICNCTRYRETVFAKWLRRRLEGFETIIDTLCQQGLLDSNGFRNVYEKIPLGLWEKKKKKVFTIITESTGTHYAFKQSNNLKTNLQWDQQSHLCQW